MKIIALPRDANPYQELLYAPMREQGVGVAYAEGPTPSQTLNVLLLPLVLLVRRLQGFDVLHLHWTFVFSLPWAGAAGKAAMQAWAVSCWRFAKLLGYRLVWTAHNAVPHEAVFANDTWTHRSLGNHADLIIAHTSVAETQLRAMGITSTIVHIPHGSYIGSYPDTTTRAAARTRLGLPAKRKVILFFGHIRPYKGIEALLVAWKQRTGADDPVLLVAGYPHDETLRRSLEDAAAANPNIRLSLGHIADTELQYYFRAADYTILPYQKSTTSGVALLACSFGSPLITPTLAAFDDIPAAAQVRYESHRLDGAIGTVTALPAAHATTASRAARAYAADLSWPHIATRTVQAIQEQPWKN